MGDIEEANIQDKDRIGCCARFCGERKLSFFQLEEVDGRRIDLEKRRIELTWFSCIDTACQTVVRKGFLKISVVLLNIVI